MYNNIINESNMQLIKQYKTKRLLPYYNNNNDDNNHRQDEKSEC